MKKRLAEIVDEITSRYEAAGEQYNVKQIEEEVLAAYEAGEILDDPIERAIHQAVERRDKVSKQEADGQLQFEGHAFARALVIGENERQPSRTGLLRHVLADQTVKEEANIRSSEAMQRTRIRNLKLLPYLERGLTVSAAVAEYLAEQNGTGAS